MKISIKMMVALGLLLLFATNVFSQESPEKPIKDLIVFKGADQKPVKSSRQVMRQTFKMPQGNSFELISTKKDNLGFKHREYQQIYKGVKVEFAKTTLNSKKGLLQSMSNNVYRIKDLSVNPEISKSEAFQNILNEVGAEEYLWQNKKEAAMTGYEKPEGELVVFPPTKNITEKPRLAYKYDIYAKKPLYRADVYVDAHTGKIIMENSKIHHANSPANGNSLYNGNVNFTASSYNGYYRLRQTVNGSGIQTFDMNNGTNYSNAQDITSNSTTFNSPKGVQAQWGAEQTYKYYNQTLGRNSFDDAGGAIKSYISYKTNYVNAFWDGTRMTYGDGDGQQYGPVIGIDVVGHEISHGMTQYSANLQYAYESGALNESFSDVFGESIEKFATGGNNDWLIGAEIGSAFRSMSNPNAYNQPDTYGGSYWQNPNCGTPSQSNDQCGVHTNSGVQNFWFYLTSVGGSGTNDIGDSYSVSSIGITKAAKIAYRNLTVYLSASSDYDNARNGSIQAAVDLYGSGSAEEKAVTNAWYAVGVGSAYQGGTTPPSSDDCIAGNVNLSITFDNYPEETGWTLKNESGTTVDSESYSSSNADGSTVTKTFSTLSAGNYTFTITDEYGDGFCCQYGSGSYTLSGSNGTIVTGGDFGSSEATTFCIEGGSADTEAPSAPNNLGVSNITETTVDLSWNAASDNVSVTEYEVYQNNSLLGTTASTSTQITGLSANTTYSFSVKANDDAGNTSSASNTVSATTAGGSSNVTYCDSQGNNASYEWIDLVELNNLTQSSSSDGGYADNTSLTANLPYGSNTIYLSAGFANSSYTEYWKVWIDYNQDGTFSSSELAVNGSSSSSNKLSASFSVPSSALAGATRMRVSMKYNSAQTACESFGYGEVEDYTVITGQNVTFLNQNPVVAENLGNEKAAFAAKIYPNPVVANTLNVQMPDRRETSYKVFSLKGNLVLEGKLSQPRIQVGKLANGVYLLKLNDGQKNIVRKFIKQ
jgi:Zn-dependent metalloprotease/chitodextrinase